jgi:hypothetical protein
MSNFYRGPSKDASYQMLIHLARRCQRRRFFRNQPIRNKNCLSIWFIWPGGFRGEDFLEINQSIFGINVISDRHYIMNGRLAIIITQHKIKTRRPFFIAWNRSHEVFHDNKLPYIFSMYDTCFHVLSIKINYLAPFKHKHKHQKLAHEK